MLLTNFNIPELVTEQVNSYLSTNKPDFSDLRKLILAKAPVPQVHASIVAILTETKEKSNDAVRKALETQAHKNQLSEDEQQKKQEQSEETKEDEEKKRLTRELNHIPTQISTCETEIGLLHRKLNRLMEAPPQVKVSQKVSTIKGKSQSSLNEHNRSIEKIRKALTDYELKIKKLLKEQHRKQIRLREIEEHSDIRKIHQNQRNMRAQATIGYSNSGEGIEKTLSGKNRSLLMKSLKAQHEALEKKCAELINDAEQINFPSFLEELQKNLNKNTSPHLTLPEVNALNTIIKLIKKHMEFEHTAQTTATSLELKKKLISSQISRLAKLKSRLNALIDNNPVLCATNQKLSSENKELFLTLDKNNKLRARLSKPALLLTTLTCLFCIPLILTVSGIMPQFLPPILLYCLFALSPASLCCATLGIGIAALVYKIKAHLNQSAIKTNELTINLNTKRMERNGHEITTMEKTTIPSLDARIKKEEDTRNLMILSLTKAQTQSQRYFNQAKQIKPNFSLSFMGSSGLSSSNENPKIKQLEIQRIEHDSENDDSSYEEELEANIFSPNPV
ncbi:Dot/Icm T4SS effector LegC3/PpeA [Legionella worsleiensis]|uniref:Kinectin 1 n=1 Tax=Legionella worsleiensis TaxID=45076 RepID=A0A0W1AFB5_9GAMM|nr:Dot/Icm T4SS effector LegC3/PpeA [Legionella worsleiensis]KTD79956.1 kinectin 1 [Legionella worsleiensis]STY33322.1 kinectin 1 [Legionella worsleiensis]